MTVELYEPREIPGITYRRTPVQYHGRADARGGHGYVYPGRLVIEGAWPADRPEDCGGYLPARWIADGLILACSGCGLDCT